MEEKLLTLNEVVAYMNIPKSTIYKLVERGVIPSARIGKQLRFRKSSLDAWLTQRENKSFSSTAGKSRNILLIDDDLLVLKTVTKFLEAQGFKVQASSSGEQALERIKNQNFDLIIADVRMPGIDGIETLQRIREFRSNSHQPAIAEIIITGFIDTEAEARAQTLGIKDYLYKPFAISDFIQAIHNRLNILSN